MSGRERRVSAAEERLGRLQRRYGRPDGLEAELRAMGDEELIAHARALAADALDVDADDAEAAALLAAAKWLEALRRPPAPRPDPKP